MAAQLNPQNHKKKPESLESAENQNKNLIQNTADLKAGIKQEKLLKRY